MEAIKISVEVSVNLSENTQNFIKSLFGNFIVLFSICKYTNYSRKIKSFLIFFENLFVKKY